MAIACFRAPGRSAACYSRGVARRCPSNTARDAGAIVVALGVSLGSALLTTRAEARAGGIEASSCTGCHGGGPEGSLMLSSSPATVSPGERAELTLSVIGGYKDGGVYVNTGDAGELQLIGGEGLRAVATGLVHERPKSASAGAVTFRFAWVAPSTPGAVRFYVYAIGGNGNNLSSGDAPMDQTFDFVYGCTGKTYYLDGDGDGFGRVDFQRLDCADKPAPASFVAEAGDCDDYDDAAHPGATEICNQDDDDCDGEIDEDVAPVELWPDADGDGYYDARTEQVGTPKMGCLGLKGWAARPGDCQPMNKDINPGAIELCNYLDDDCDGDVDERVRPTCGEGWCRRESPSCDPQYCVAGDPVPEKCNLLDDDCDGELDEEPDACPTGQRCDAGACVSASGGSGGAPPSGQAGTPPAGGGSAGSSGSVGMAGAGAGPRAAGCALGPRTTHAGLAALVLSMAAVSGRRRRGAQRRR
jgi:hypothetical protein